MNDPWIAHCPSETPKWWASKMIKMSLLHETIHVALARRFLSFNLLCKVLFLRTKRIRVFVFVKSWWDHVRTIRMGRQRSYAAADQKVAWLECEVGHAAC